MTTQDDPFKREDGRTGHGPTEWRKSGPLVIGKDGTEYDLFVASGLVIAVALLCAVAGLAMGWVLS